MAGPHTPKEVVIEEHKRLRGGRLEFAEGSSDPQASFGSRISIENYNILRKAQEMVKDHGFTIKEDSFTRSFEKEHLPCRLEELPTEKLSKGVESVAFDVGHNPDALGKTLAAYLQRHDNKPAVVVYGCKERKDFQACLEKISPKCQNIFVVQAKNTKGVVEARQIYEGGVAANLPVKRVGDKGDISQTLSEICSEIEHGKLRERHVLVIGSFTLMREAREYFGLHCPTD